MNQKKYIEDLIKQFQYYKDLADQAIEQLNEEQFFYQQHADVNSIAIIVKHISGNLLSRFTDFRTTDGEKNWRNRDEEFIIKNQSKKDFLELWNIAWTVLLDELNKLQPEDLSKDIVIRNHAMPIPSALQRSLAHASHHIGQILYQGKILKGSDWNSLSIPKGESQTFNDKAINTKKEGGHYTDNLLRKNK